VTSIWSQVSGPGMASFADTSAIDTAVSFDTEGTYVLKLSADDSALTGEATVNVVVLPVGSSLDAGPASDAGVNSSGGMDAGAVGSNGGTVSSGGASGSANPGSGQGGTLAGGASTQIGGRTSGGASTGGSTTASGAAPGTNSAPPAPKQSGSCACETTRPSAGYEFLTILAVAAAGLGRRSRQRKQDMNDGNAA
jgi:MYXO-CTERM domain-containing protein